LQGATVKVRVCARKKLDREGDKESGTVGLKGAPSGGGMIKSCCEKENLAEGTGHNNATAHSQHGSRASVWGGPSVSKKHYQKLG